VASCSRRDTASVEANSTSNEEELSLSTNVHSMSQAGVPSGMRHGCGLLNERQAAELLNVKVATLRRWRWAGKGPAFLKIGGAVRYDPAELDRVIGAARRTSTSDPGVAVFEREAA
jgi:hypothetical protein